VSRVGLAEERDALGMQKLLIDWRYTPQDVATVREAVRLLAAIGAVQRALNLNFDRR